MTPAARIAAAIGILDAILGGEPADRVLANWARKSRYAGSGDRAAVRDHVFDALRCRRSFAWHGGAETGRGLILGLLRQRNIPENNIFTGATHAPAPLDAREIAFAPGPAPDPVRLDCPDWLWDRVRADLGASAESVLTLMQSRAPLFLRANLLKADRETAIAALAADGIEGAAHPLSPTAIEITGNPRRVTGSRAFRSGLVEIQDAASQAVVDTLPLGRGDRVLDFCAGGGGKALAMAARTHSTVYAHDANTRRMRDIPARAARAGADVVTVLAQALEPAGYDLVLCDAPCSGSGAWRRNPESKWTLTAERLDALVASQAAILEAAAALVRPGGHLAYATCSVFDVENRAQIQSFIEANELFDLAADRLISPIEGGDGFYVALLTRKPAP